MFLFQHFIDDCPDRTKPPEGYICKICNTVSSACHSVVLLVQRASSLVIFSVIVRQGALSVTLVVANRRRDMYVVHAGVRHTTSKTV